MGSFSWTKADQLTQVSNIPYKSAFKCLIPKEFGGGFIKDHYKDYGLLGEPDAVHSDAWDADMAKYDMFELLALWNCPDKCKFNGEYNPMKPIDEFTKHNRAIGIVIGCYDEDVDKLKFPLKLVSASYKGTYEECSDRSYSDPAQGFRPTYRKTVQPPLYNYR